MSLLFVLVVVWWLAAPDRFTAAARTATGTGMRAAGSGAASHWRDGKPGRELGRTGRRDRWAKRGGWWRKLLGLEHGAVITGKAVKGAGKLAGAAVKPVPGAIRDGWRAGQARHGARTAGRPVPVALDPPWWRKPGPAPVPDGALDQDGWPAPDFHTGAIVNPMPYLNSPAGTDPADATTPTATKGQPLMGLRDAITGSARDPESGATRGATATLTRPTEGGEVDDLATLQRIAAQVVQQHEDSEFMKLVRLCQTLPETTDFGQRVGTSLAEFAQLCVSLGKVGAEVAEMAPGVAKVAGRVRGES